MKPPGKFPGIAAAVTTAAAAVLLAVPLLSSPAQAATAAPAAPARTAASAAQAKTAAPATVAAVTAAPAPAGNGAAPAAHPVTHTCTTETRPGYAACFALKRTDVTGRKGLFTATANARAPKSAAAAAAASADDTAPSGYGPAELQNAYNLPSATAGSGQTVAVVDAFDDPNAEADLQVYRAQYGLPACTTANGCFRKVAQDGSTNYPPPDPTGGWESEESLDLDMVSAICPNCHILLVEADDNSNTNLGMAVDEAVALGAKFVSNSYGGSEDPNETTIEDAYYNHPGVAITASSGDGSWLAGPEYPAASQYVTAVGGTTLTPDSSVARGWDETAWVDGGSGCSAYEPKPAWQTDTGCANRTIADVSADADPNTGVAVYDTYGQPGWTVFGGTSVASPIIASVFALAGTPAAGTYPSSYPYAHTSDLNDVTSGTNIPPGDASCDSPLRYNATAAYVCTAGRGYDGPTGWGTPDGTAAFTFGPHGTVTGTVTSSATRKPVAGAAVAVGSYSAVTSSSGRFSVPVPAGSYTLTVTDFGYATRTLSVQVRSGQTLTEDLRLRPVPSVKVSGTVTDGSGQGWPLYAKVSVSGTPVSAYTSPATGKYSLTLPDNASYSLTVDPAYAGYQQATATVQAGTANLTQNFSVPVDAEGCSAGGYQVDYNGSTQTFDGSTAPDGWSVVTVPGSDTSWQFGASPDGLTNDTGGSGGFAAITETNNPTDSTLVSPVYDLSQDTSPYLQFDTDFAPVGPTVNIDVSIDGGQTWNTVWGPTSNGIAGPATETVPLPTAAGQSQVEVRFHWSMPYYDLGVDAYWEIDSVFVGNRACDPTTGGLVEGTASDANTGAGVDGVTVASVADPGVTATTVPTGDPAVGEGFYYLFAPGTGSEQFTAAKGDYTTTTASATVTSGAVTPLNFSLPTGHLVVTQRRLSATEVMGSSGTRTLTFRNTGTAPVTVALSQQDGQFTLASQPADAPREPVVRVNGSYTPDTVAQLTRAGKDAAAALLTPSAAGGAQPADAPWTDLASFPQAAGVFDNSMVTDPATGLVYSVGGVGIDSSGSLAVLDNLYVYNPATLAWTALPDMTYAREKPSVAFIGGELYVAGGFDNNGDPVPSVEIYNPVTGVWSTGANMPLTVNAAGVTVLGNDLYVIGGCDYFACDRTEVQVYHPSTNTWTLAAPYPEPLGWQSCGTISGKIYCAGGIDSVTDVDTSDAYVYDPAANSWSPIASYPIDNWAAGYGVSDGQLLISGGVTAESYQITNQGWAYDPANNTWTQLPNSNETDYRGGSACGFYLAGGIDGIEGNPSATFQQLPGYSCGSTSAPWLSESTTQLTVSPGHAATVTVTLNAGDPSVSQPGTYTAALDVTDNTPYPSPSVGVTLHAEPPASWGKIAGTVSGTDCSGNTTVLSGAEVEIIGTTDDDTLTTGPDGTYALWLDVAQNPLTVVATDDNWNTDLSTVSIRRGRTTTASFTLTPLSC